MEAALVDPVWWGVTAAQAPPYPLGGFGSSTKPSHSWAKRRGELCSPIVVPDQWEAVECRERG